MAYVMISHHKKPIKMHNKQISMMGSLWYQLKGTEEKRLVGGKGEGRKRKLEGCQISKYNNHLPTK
jgi:hypothetical protein